MRFPQSIFKTTPFSKDSNTQKTKLSDAFNKPINDWDNSTCAEARTAVSESISSMIQVEFTFHGRKTPIRLVGRLADSPSNQRPVGNSLSKSEVVQKWMVYKYIVSINHQHERPGTNPCLIAGQI